MKTPSRDPSDFHVAHGAETTLQVPEKAKCSHAPKRFRHMIAFAFFEVGFIGRVVRVSFALDLNVSSNGRVTGQQQSHFVQYAVSVARFPKESPVVLSLPLKIFLFEPASGLFWMPSSGPLPQTDEDSVVNALKDAFTHDVPMIVGPALYFGVQPINRFGSRQAQASFNYLSDAIQEDFHVLLGRLNEQFPTGILAHVLSEEIKALLHVRDDRLLGRKFQPTWLQKPLDQGLNFSFQ